jgi:hypothetical protein
MIRLALITLALVFIESIQAQDKQLFVANTLSGDLKENADAVYRYEFIDCNIISPELAKIRYSYVITVLNERGLKHADIELPYSSFMKVSSLKGTVYKADGKKLKSILYDDVIDISTNWGSTLYSDSRVKLYRPPTKTTPFTIVYTYNVELKGSLFLESWLPVKGTNVSVGKSIYKVTVQPGVDFKYKEFNITEPVQIAENKGAKEYVWKLENYKAQKFEPFSGSYRNVLPYVSAAINKFRFYDTDGSLESWNAFGQWIYKLNEGRSELSPATIAEARRLTENATTDREKVDILYRYMQSKTRYVNIAIGIGGWQPIPAARVDEVCYGDCKALSNYMKSLLDSVGVVSKYIIIRAGDQIPEWEPDFVKSEFNHAILCVPQPTDTIWLECTTQKYPTGFLSTFTDDRMALLVDGENSKLVKTPELKGFANGERRNATLVFDANFNAVFDVKAQYGGKYMDRVYWWQIDDNEQVRRKTLESLSFGSVNLSEFAYTICQDRNTVEQHLKFNVPSLAAKMGNRYVVELNHLSRQEYVPSKVFNRVSDVRVQRNSVESDTVNIILPEGFVLESGMKPQHFSCEFGEYKAHLTIEDNRLQYVRNVVFNKGVYPKESYGKLITFFEDIKFADQQKVILLPATAN